MTAFCGGGTSGPDPSAAAVVTYSAGLIADLLVGVSSPWLIPVIPLLGLGPQVLSTFCATDPPTATALTSAEAQALLTLQLGTDFDNGLTKARNMVLNAIWLNSCVCTSGALVPYTAPAPPAGAPIVSYSGSTTDGPCARYQRPLVSTGSAGTPSSVGGVVVWVTGAIWTTGGGVTAFHNVPVGSPFTSMTVKITNTATTGAGQTLTYLGAQTSDGHTTAATGDHALQTVTIAPGQTKTIQLFYDSTNPYTADKFSSAGTGISRYDIDANVYCTGLNGVTSPCCPPDQISQAYLDNILNLVTLIQRQLVPFATIHGASHSGLSGNGQFAVNGILGLLVDITTAPARLGSVTGDPNSVYGAGWINVGTSDGWGPRFFVSSDPFILRPVSGDVTLVGYSIPADVVVTITEIVREP